MAGPLGLVSHVVTSFLTRRANAGAFEGLKAKVPAVSLPPAARRAADAAAAATRRAAAEAVKAVDVPATAVRSVAAKARAGIAASTETVGGAAVGAASTVASAARTAAAGPARQAGLLRAEMTQRTAQNLVQRATGAAKAGDQAAVAVRDAALAVAAAVAKEVQSLRSAGGSLGRDALDAAGRAVDKAEGELRRLGGDLDGILKRGAAAAGMGAAAVGVTVSEYGLPMPAGRVEPIVSTASADDNRKSAAAWVAAWRAKQ